MNVGINNNYSYNTTKANYTKNTDKAADEAEKTTEAGAEATTQTTEPIVQKPETYKPDMDKINSMKADMKNNNLAFKQMVYSMIKQQGGYADNALSSLLKIDSKTQLEAQDAISADGEWGVDKTAQRILDFAKALCGGDASKLSTLKDGILKGFEAAEKVWGGSLPDICYQTKQKIMDTMDEWEKTGKME